MDDRTYATLVELLADAVDCPRLSDWEDGFLANMRGRVSQHGRHLTLSDRQRDALKRIEQKVYACG